MAKQWFLPSIKDDFEVVIRDISEGGASAGHRYGTAGFNDMVRQQFAHQLDFVRENMGEVVVFSDVDIQFFRPARELLHAALEGRDIVFQRDAPNGTVNTGFIALKANAKTLHFCEQVLAEMHAKPHLNDQEVINALLIPEALEPRTPGLPRSPKQARLAIRGFLHRLKLSAIYRRSIPRMPNPFGLAWNYLPVEFYCPGIETGLLWNPGMALDVPRNIVMHHANWTLGVENKVAQLACVKELVEGRRA